VTTYTADWILPIADEPIAGGFVAVADGRIAGVGRERRTDARDLGRVAVMPALVNAHTHLELSYLHRRVPPGTAFTEWVRTLMALRRQYPNPEADEIVTAARAAVTAAQQAGTGLVGDISNTLMTVPLLRDMALPAQVFYELIGFNADDPVARVMEARRRADALSGGDVRVSLAPHAPYSVAGNCRQGFHRSVTCPGSGSSIAGSWWFTASSSTAMTSRSSARWGLRSPRARAVIVTSGPVTRRSRRFTRWTWTWRSGPTASRALRT